MNSSDYDALFFRIRVLEGDNKELKRIIEDYRRLERNLRTLIKQKNLEIEKLTNKSKQFTFNDYR